ncbi:hypothetical protein G7Y79_00060g092080 [Physcia stellaris]|nr:hypothetical protein G7Y79_00060g092080 [Physcia stellaris]
MLPLPTLLTTLSLLPLALTIPHPSPDPLKAHHSQKFTLSSHVLSPPNPAFEGLVLEPYHISPAFNYAVLEKAGKGKEGKGVVGYLNGTREELRDGFGDLLFRAGADAKFSYGFVIDRVNATYNPVEINAGEGTKGIFIDQGVIKYQNPQSGGFYACNTTLPYGPAVQVFYKPKTISTPAGCSDVELVVEYV